MNQLKRTLGIIKPDAVSAGNIGNILAMIEHGGFEIKGLRMLRLRQEHAQAFYAVHRGKHFFESLVAFMTEGPVVVMVLEKENAIEAWRALMGPTDPAKAPKGTVREAYGTNIERNAVHGSDGNDTAAFELGFFFSGANLV